MPDVLQRPFNQINIPYSKREMFLEWLAEYTIGKVYIWPGLVTPSPGSTGWGHFIAPNEELTFVIFENNSDQTRFALEFVGNPVGMSAYTYKNGLDAYHSRKR